MLATGLLLAVIKEGWMSSSLMLLKGSVCYGRIYKGDFVVEYRGDLISSEENERRLRVYHDALKGFMFDFIWNGKFWSIDAARDDGSLGRLVNDEHISPNCKMKRIIVDGKPHLCLFALRDITSGEEITYNYGVADCPWRTKVSIFLNH
ncbi:N-lysine methyltransferase KMT5A-A-like [Astyanax mexicanus]|uniref:N-lysine methyltransferase KMT5A-A-like n=1 Tax=Astyanax mexicanus TaxID=7994 RepID=A0A8T2MJY8_ASTMX|nr:N-lysine methyltransferase KMT5A-A-like [Astyanax mexicanus]